MSAHSSVDVQILKFIEGARDYKENLYDENKQGMRTLGIWKQQKLFKVKNLNLNPFVTPPNFVPFLLRKILFSRIDFFLKSPKN